MTSLGLPTSTINAIVANPALLANRLDPASQATNPLPALGITPEIATLILAGYTRGFRAIFILNAALAAFAMLSSVFMIGQKNLERGDEQALREKAAAESARNDAPVVVEERHTDIEMGVLPRSDVKPVAQS